MTTKQRHLRKLGNAVRAFAGRKYKTFSGPTRWFRAPDKGALVRVERWMHRCQQRGYLHKSFTAEKLVS